MYLKPKKKTAEEKKQEKYLKLIKKKPIKKKKKTTETKKKRISTRKLHKECDTLFSKIVRLRDRVCQRCGTEENLQNSHTIPRSASKSLVFDEINCIALCLHDHLYWWHKDPIDASAWFQEKFPERYEYLQVHKFDFVPKRTIDDYIILKERLKKRLEELRHG